MNKILDISDEQFSEVMKLLALHLPDIQVWAYGSRAKFKARPQSDLDLVVFVSKDQRDSVYSLREAFEESSLPFQVDIFIWDDIPKHFKKNIIEENIVLQKQHFQA